MVRSTRRRSFNVIAAVDRVRELHPELRVPLTITHLRRVLEHEEIAVLRRPIKAYAYVEGGLGSFVVVMRAGLNPRHERRVLGHEYAHIKLHFAEAGEVVYQRVPCRRGDPRELEAQLFVRLLELGPAATPEHPDVAKLVAALDAPAFIRPAPAQLDLPLPEATPAYRPPSKRLERFGHGSHNPDAVRAPRRQRARMAGSTIGLGCSHDALLFDWARDGKPLRYFHVQLGWIDVYDLLAIGEGARRRVVTLECGDRRAQCRVFVISSTDRRRYLFAEGEQRDRSPKALDRQLARAERLTTRASVKATQRERTPR